MPHSEKMRIIERIYLNDEGLLQNNVTIEDPVVFTRPYEFTFGYKREEDYKLAEYVCDDNLIILNDDGTFEMYVEPQPGQ